MLVMFQDALGNAVRVNPAQVTYISDYLGNTAVHFGREHTLTVMGSVAQVAAALDAGARIR